MLQAVWFDAGPGREGHLLLAIHHLAVDGVSWRILVPDFMACLEAVCGGAPASLGPRSTSFRTWARRLATHAHDPGLLEELAFWTGMLRKQGLAVTDAPLDAARDVIGTAGRLSLTLPAETAGPLLGSVPAAFHGSIDDVMLTALVLALAGWCRQRGRPSTPAALIELEGHGREELFPDLDLSRTVGWFTTLFPVRLDAGPVDLDDALTGGDSLGRAIKLVKEQRRSVPNNGIGYGLLRYANPQTATQLARLGTPQIGFNYLGRFVAPSTANGNAPESMPLPGGDPAMPLSHVIEVDALTIDGADGPVLTAHWVWASALLGEDDVRDLAQGWFRVLAAIVRHAARPGAGGHTPSDLPLVALSQAEIELLEKSYAD